MRIYFSGIGGVGIGPLAMLALDAGFSVSGSDLQESEMTKHLQARGVTIYFGKDESNISQLHTELDPIHWLVHSSAIPSDHPELVFAHDHGIQTSKRDGFLNMFLKGKNLELVAIAGTHGKTTTTAMITWLFRELDQQVSYSIGTTVGFGPSAQYQVGARYFIYECDEFDRNFLHFQPYISTITSIDYDHPDTYPTQSEYQAAFKQFITQSQHTLLWDQAVQYMGLPAQETITVFNMAQSNLEAIALPGKHMRANAWLAAQTVAKLLPDQNIEVLQGMLANFPGTTRRFEQLSENIYTDYAHHPVEIAATIAMAKELNSNVVVIYQPHQNIRQHEIVREDAYNHCFEGTQVVYWLPTYLSREDPQLEILSPTQLMITTSPGTQTEYSEMNESLWQKILAHQKSGDLVLCMSAGDLDPWLRAQVANKGTSWQR